MAPVFGIRQGQSALRVTCIHESNQLWTKNTPFKVSEHVLACFLTSFPNRFSVTPLELPWSCFSYCKFSEDDFKQQRPTFLTSGICSMRGIFLWTGKLSARFKPTSLVCTFTAGFELLWESKAPDPVGGGAQTALHVLQMQTKPQSPTHSPVVGSSP